jgi:hypothetical protein
MFASDESLDMPPIGSCLGDRFAAFDRQPDAIPAAGTHLYVTELHDMSALAADVKAAWTVLVATSVKSDSQAIRAHVAHTLADFGCLPSQVLDRLTRSPVKPIASWCRPHTMRTTDEFSSDPYRLDSAASAVRTRPGDELLGARALRLANARLLNLMPRMTSTLATWQTPTTSISARPSQVPCASGRDGTPDDFDARLPEAEIAA